MQIQSSCSGTIIELLYTVFTFKSVNQTAVIMTVHVFFSVLIGGIM